MNPKLQTALDKAVLKLSGECVELSKDLTTKYVIKTRTGTTEYTETLCKGIKIDKSFKDKEFRSNFFKLFKIIELTGG